MIKHRFTDRQKDLASLVLLVCLTFILLWRVVFLGHVLLPLDMVFKFEPWNSEVAQLKSAPWNPEITDAIWQFYPMGSYSQQAWHEGIPLWDPNTLGGMPALARGEMFSNPLFNLLAVFLPVMQAISWTAVIHLLVGSLSIWLLLRMIGAQQFGALIGSLAFTFNAYLVGWLSLPVVTGSMVWLPLIFLGIELALKRHNWKWLFLSALGFTIQILSGSIIWAFYSAITLFLFNFYRSLYDWLNTKRLYPSFRPVIYAGSALLIGATIASPQLLLTIELYFNTKRSTALGTLSFLDLPNLIRLIAPNITGNPLFGNQYNGPFNYTETDLYFGILPLFFVVVSLFSPNKKLAWGFSGLGLITLLAAYGITPFRQIITMLYPVFINVFPGRIFFITAFTWAVAAGLGADWLTAVRPIKLSNALSTAALLLACSVAAIIGLANYYPEIGKESIFFIAGLSRRLAKIDINSLYLPLILLIITTVLLLSARRGWLSIKAFQGLVLATVIIDLFAIGINYNPAFDAGIAFPDAASLTFLTELSIKTNQPFRIVTVSSNTILPGMVPELYSLPTVSGYSSWVLKRYLEFTELTQLRSPTPINYVYFTDCCHPLLDAMNVEYIYSSPDTLPRGVGSLSLIASLPNARLKASNAGNVHTTAWMINGVNHPVLFEHPPTSISYPLEINSPAVFKSAIAIDPSAWHEKSDGVLFEVLASYEETGTEQVLFSRYLDPHLYPADRQWVPVEIDLSRFAGTRINLTLETGAGPEGNESYDWAGWAYPQIEYYYPSTLELIYDGPNKVYRNLESLPRAWVVHEVKEVAENDIESVKKELSALGFDPGSGAIIEGMLNADLGTAHADDQVIIASYSDARVELEVNIKEPGLLVLSDVMYPGWKVFVDGIEQPIIITNLIMRGVYLPGGNHLVVFMFKPVLLSIGLLFSGIALLITFIALIWPARGSFARIHP